jgi:glutathione S-transferase
MIMLTVYSISESLYCAKLRIVLRHKNLAWQEIEPPGGYWSDEYRNIIPSGNLPALIDGNLALGDSEAIAEYLNESYSEPPMLPLDVVARAKARERSRFHDTRLEPELRLLFAHTSHDKKNPAIVEKQAEIINRRLKEFANMIASDSPDPLSLADCGFPITFAWIDAFIPLLELNIEWPEQVLKYRQTIENQPAVAAELVEYLPEIQTWLSSRNAS